jgi:hypothetical protein
MKIKWTRNFIFLSERKWRCYKSVILSYQQKKNEDMIQAWFFLMIGNQMKDDISNFRKMIFKRLIDLKDSFFLYQIIIKKIMQKMLIRMKLNVWRWKFSVYYLTQELISMFYHYRKIDVLFYTDGENKSEEVKI